ncbi:DUF6652 family protein [Lachnospiraceae bacterium 62-35]
MENGKTAGNETENLLFTKLYIGAVTFLPLTGIMIALIFYFGGRMLDGFSGMIFLGGTILEALWGGAAFILGVINVILSFLDYRKDPESCVRKLIVMKYGLVPFFALNYLILFLIGFVIAVVSMGISLLWYIPVFTFTTWACMIPGAFYGIQTIRLCRKEKGMTIFPAIVHGVLQFCFVVDVLDTMYLTIHEFGRGKKAAIVVAAIYGVLTAAAIIAECVIFVMSR